MTKIVWTVLALILAFNPAAAPQADASGPKRVFILHSYEFGHVCGQPQHDGVIKALKDAGYIPGRNLKLGVYAMDTKRKNNTPALIAEQARIALEKIKEFNPDVLVTLDDNAFRSVALKLVDSGVPIVFSGMNGQPEDYNAAARWLESRTRPGHNITGVYEKLHFVNAVKVHKQIIPSLTGIRMFTDTSPTGRALVKQVQLELAETPLPCRFDMVVAKSWEEYKRAIKKTNDDPDVQAIYPVALLLKDRSGKTYTAPEIFRWTVTHSRKPALAVNFAFTRLGLFGGAGVDFKAMGRQAGRMVVEILQGRNPGSIAIEDARRYALVFNLKRAEELGVVIPQDILLAADEVYE